MYSTANRSLYRHVVCCVPVSCKANGVGNQLGAWRYSDLLAILYQDVRVMKKEAVIVTSAQNLCLELY